MGPCVLISSTYYKYVVRSRYTVHILVPVQMFGEVNSQELVAVHTLDLTMVHRHIQWSAV